MRGVATSNEYDSFPFATGLAAGLVANRIRTSTPGSSRVEGSRVFAHSGWDNFDHIVEPHTYSKRLIDPQGAYRSACYCVRLATRSA